MPNLLNLPIESVSRLLACLERAFLHLTQPARHSLLLSTTTDLTRSRIDLIAENALLRQQLIILHRQMKKPRFIPADRLWLLLLILRPETCCVGIGKAFASSGSSNRELVAVAREPREKRLA